MPTNDVTMSEKMFIHIFPCLQEILKVFLYHQVYSSYKINSHMIIYDKDPNFKFKSISSEYALTVSPSTTLGLLPASSLAKASVCTKPWLTVI